MPKIKQIELPKALKQQPQVNLKETSHKDLYSSQRSLLREKKKS